MSTSVGLSMANADADFFLNQGRRFKMQNLNIYFRMYDNQKKNNNIGLKDIILLYVRVSIYNSSRMYLIFLNGFTGRTDAVLLF